MSRLPLLTTLFSTLLVLNGAAQDLRLWYTKPASRWTEALPVGNGRLGAMVFSGANEEHIQFNEESLWNGGPRNYNRKGAHQYLGQIRELLAQGKQKEADELAEKQFMGLQSDEGNRKEWIDKMYAVSEPAKPAFNDASWKIVHMPSYEGWEAKGLNGLDGAVWLRKEINWSGDSEGLVLDLNRIRDADRTFINGILIGTQQNNDPRIYKIPSGLLKNGKNVIAVQVLNFTDKGGITGYKDTTRHIGIRKGEALVLDVQGNWNYWVQNEAPPPVPRYQADYQPFGDLHLAFNHTNVSGYHRELNIRDAIQRTNYTANGVQYRRQVYATAVDQAIVTEIHADKAASISTSIWMDALHPGSTFRKLDDSTYALNVKVRHGALFGESRLRVRQTGGVHRFEKGRLNIENADKLVLFLTAASNFKRFDDITGNPAAICQQQLSAISKRSIDQLRNDHIKDYQKIFNRFAIHFGYSPQEDKPTNQRIDEFAQTNDPSLLALYTQYGRYLLISSSRPGTMPANLQGIWNDLISPPWGSKYTTNINAEMNYWPAELLNLSDHHEPLFRMITELAERGRETAKEYYNARGWVLHHNTDLWRGTSPINAANHGIWQTGGAWLSHHLWEHFLFTRDTSFLRKYYPVMRDAAVFFLDAMIRDPKTGWYITSPSNSPEQGGLVAGPAMDHQIVRSLFKAVIQAGTLLRADKLLLDSMSARLKSIAPDQIGKYGQLQEWMEDVDDPNNRHRHVSHLWAVYPGTEITWSQNPKYVDAARQSLIFRRDAATGWSLGWKINLWARFKDGDHVYKLLQMLLSPADKMGAGSYPNLFDAHPPFQIDGNFGGASGIVEMLLQSHDGFIDILPALPSILKEGQLRGVKARGGAELDFAWENGSLTYLDIRSAKGGVYELRYGPKKGTVRLKPNSSIRLNAALEPIVYQVKEMQVDDKRSPIGIQSMAPRFSWMLASDRSNTMQKAWQIQVSTNPSFDPKALVWDSGKKAGARSIGTSYLGKMLSADTRYYWRVQSWDDKGRTSGWALDSFQTALFEKADWKGARWIAMQSNDTSIRVVPLEHGKGKIKKSGEPPVLPIFRTDFTVDKDIKRATAYVTGLGQFEFHLNGEKVGDHFLDPGWTNYDKEVLYQSFDITDKIRKGKNAAGMLLGNGMYHVPASRYRKFTGAFGYPKMICMLSIEYIDGSKKQVISNDEWRMTTSPILYSSIFGGEDMDARKWPKGFDSPGFDASGWQQPLVVENPAKLVCQFFEPLRFADKFDVRSMREMDAKTTVYDLGQNASGIPYIEVEGNPGDTVRILAGELLANTGFVTQGATGGPSYFQYILSGEGVERWAPRFTYTGFRYLQVEKHPVSASGKPMKWHLIQAWHNRADAEKIGTFNTSNDLFNRTDTLINWAIQSNMQSVFTDCPHREKLGWLEQVHLMGNSIRFGYDVRSLLRKTLMDVRAAQTPTGHVPTIAPEFTFFPDAFGDSPEWGSTAILTPWDVYRWYGDRSVLEENYGTMQRYIGYLNSKEDGGLLYFGLGDWYDLGSNHPGYSQLTPRGLTPSAVYYQNLKVMENVAQVLGKLADEQRYRKEAARIFEAFQQKFFNSKTGNYGTGSQTSNAMPLAIGLVPESLRSRVLQNLIDSITAGDFRITAGDIGFRYLINTLVKAGRSDIIYRMNNRSDVPGYGYQLAKGATALTESWQALASVSNNHLMLGHLKEWFYAGLAGFGEADPTAAHLDLTITPQIIPDIHQVSASYRTAYGPVKSSWHWEGEKAVVSIEVPVNARIRLTLPGQPERRIGSGLHSFIINPTK